MHVCARLPDRICQRSQSSLSSMRVAFHCTRVKQCAIIRADSADASVSRDASSTRRRWRCCAAGRCVTRSYLGTIGCTTTQRRGLLCRMLPSTGRGAVPCADESDQSCYGGLARIAAVCKAQKAANPSSLCLDAGDSFSGSYWADVDTDGTYLSVMNTFVDAYVVGNHDFDKGALRLAQCRGVTVFHTHDMVRPPQPIRELPRTMHQT